MNISQRLRKLADSTGLDAFGDEIRAIADEMDEQPAEVTDDDIVAVMRDGNNCNYNDEAEHIQFARAILALRPVPMTDELFDLICNAIDKADTITMEGDYMLDSDDCIAVVRVMQALLSVHHGITAKAKKETP